MVVHGFLAKPPFTNQLRHKEQMDRLNEAARSMAGGPDAGSLAGDRRDVSCDDRQGPGRLAAALGLRPDARGGPQAVRRGARAVPDRAETPAALPHAARFARRGASHQGRSGGRHRRVREAPGHQADLRHLRTTTWAGATRSRAGRTLRRISSARRSGSSRTTCPPTSTWPRCSSSASSFQEAEKVCREGLAIAPNHAMLHGNLGLLLIKTGRREEGATEIRRAAGTRPRLRPNPQSSPKPSSVPVQCGSRLTILIRHPDRTLYRSTPP